MDGLTAAINCSFSIGCGVGSGAMAWRLTAQNLKAGCREVGSMASLVTALIARFSPNTSLQ
ncbi:hypothetical protein D3C86_2072650 [compost metagenome]